MKKNSKTIVFNFAQIKNLSLLIFNFVKKCKDGQEVTQAPKLWANNLNNEMTVPTREEIQGSVPYAVGKADITLSDVMMYKDGTQIKMIRYELVNQGEQAKYLYERDVGEVKGRQGLKVMKIKDVTDENLFYRLKGPKKAWLYTGADLLQMNIAA